LSPPLPRRPLTVTFALLLGLSSLGLAGCAGEIDPRLELGPTGGGGSTGAPCDAPAMVFDRSPNPLCAQLGCHDANATAQAGLNLKNDGAIAARLVGVMASGTNGSVCGGVTTPYLAPGSQPATGLLLDKMFATTLPCAGGNRMPSLGTLTSTDMACIISWANDLTKP
jgi:hypothetical protein